MDSTKDAYAFSAEGKDSDTAAVSTITGSGVYNIVGDIRAADGGILTLDLAEGSQFEGKAVLDSGNASQSTLTMAKNSLWTLTGDSQLSSLQNEQSVIDMTGDNKAFSTLSVETLTGNGGRSLWILMVPRLMPVIKFMSQVISAEAIHCH